MQKLQESIIETLTLPWRVHVLLTTNDRHKRRMVVGYSQTINRYTLVDVCPLPRTYEVASKTSRYAVFNALNLRSDYYQIAIAKRGRLYTAFGACGRLYQFGRTPFGVIYGVACFQCAIDRIIHK